MKVASFSLVISQGKGVAISKLLDITSFFVFIGTLDEEEMLNPEDYQEELRILRDDAALTIEQLRAKYCSDVPGVAANGTSEDGESCSTAPYEISNGVEEHQPHANGNSEIGKFFIVPVAFLFLLLIEAHFYSFTFNQVE